MKKSFILYTDSFDTIQHLTDEQLGRLTRLLFQYQIDGSIPHTTDLLFYPFGFIRATMDRDALKWNNRAEKSKENGAKGGRPKTTQSVIEETQKTQQVILEPREPVSVSVSVNGSVSGSVNERKQKEPKSKTDFVVLVDSKKYFGNDPTLKELFVDFIDMRIRMKKTPTEKALDILAKKLHDLSKGSHVKARKIIENSIERNWAGFFDIDSSTSFSKPIQPTFSRAANGVHFSGANQEQ
jgi:hypothetical protein